ncbi:hypothetical protein, partial [Sphingobium chlorophenolicum]|uniref:hypothetical protein n=1 Tax=Sphingobium chlorophenolicum TaxID=46429 RepID=UPI001BDBEDBF
RAHQIFDGRYRWSILIPGHGGAPLGLATLNITSLPWPLKSSMDFAEHPAHYQPGVSSTWVTSQWKYRPFPGQLSVAINK